MWVWDQINFYKACLKIKTRGKNERKKKERKKEKIMSFLGFGRSR